MADFDDIYEDDITGDPVETPTDIETPGGTIPPEEVIPAGVGTDASDTTLIDEVHDDIPSTVTTEDAALSGVEQYLSQFDIEGGMIAFDDGTSKHFDELDATKQSEVLSNLHKSNATSVEDTYGLDDNEVGFINHLRENKLSVNDMVESMATERLQAMQAVDQAVSKDYKEMSDDAIYATFLRDGNPDLTAEQLEKDLASAKAVANYTNVVSNIRTGFEREQEVEIAKAAETKAKDHRDLVESQRQEVVDTIKNIDTLDGLGLNDGIKNSVLDTILSVDSDGDSVFMTEVFSDPEKLFRAAFWYNNGTDILKSREDYWKKQKSEAFKRGQAAGTSGKISFEKTKNTTPTSGGFDETESFDDLYD